MSSERTHPTPDTHDSREAIRERLMGDPAVRERIERGLDRLERGDTVGPGMTREQLQDFLRDDA